ncbi:hypothetical protein CAC42_2175 [Sphaceloma murrayae]|uniref:Uncharacterized protein n=1 Tax=Sphaceloma murrayae TaxID=2082308 RepID=A0A2K1QIG6_9PEZI|nr:hypothetical protein CAC42_2175 [Sphaceloma murrayae]
MASMLIKLAVMLIGLLALAASSSLPLSLGSSSRPALEVLQGFEYLPTCAKVATAQLITTCDVIENASNIFFETLHKTYAARLAICEVAEGGLPIPAACAKFIPTPETVSKIAMQGSMLGGLHDSHTTYPKYDAQTAADTVKCTKALGGASQYWTSYSNNLQNAAHICQAKQNEMATEQFMHSAKLAYEMTTQSQELNAHLEQAIKDARESTLKQQNSFATVFNEVATSGKEVLGIASVVMSTAVQLGNFTSSLIAAVSAVASLNGYVDNLKEQLRDVDLDMAFIRDDLEITARRAREADAQFQAAFSNVNDSLSAMNDSIADIPQQLNVAITHAVSSFSEDIFIKVASLIFRYAFAPGFVIITVFFLYKAYGPVSYCIRLYQRLTGNDTTSTPQGMPRRVRRTFKRSWITNAVTISGPAPITGISSRRHSARAVSPLQPAPGRGSVSADTSAVSDADVPVPSVEHDIFDLVDHPLPHGQSQALATMPASSESDVQGCMPDVPAETRFSPRMTMAGRLRGFTAPARV